MPDVSVVIPTHNRTTWLKQAVESVFCQTYSSLELIVVDDGSTTEEARRLISDYPQVKYVYQQNQGAGAARNTGIAHSAGKFIQFLDDDDWLTPDAIKVKVNAISRNPSVRIVYSDLYLTNLAGNVQGRWFDRYPRPLPQGDIYLTLLKHNFITPLALLYEKQVLLEHGGFPNRSGSEDWECLLKAAESAQIAFIDAALGYYRLHPQNITHDAQRRLFGETVIQKYVVGSSRFAEIPAKDQAATLVSYAFQQWLYGDEALSSRFISQATMLYPRNFKLTLLKGLRIFGKRFGRFAHRQLLKVRFSGKFSAEAYFFGIKKLRHD